MLHSLNTTFRHTLRFFYRARHIFVAWMVVNLIFGLIYFYMSTSNPLNGLEHKGQLVQSVWDHIYFSFITSTAIGYGDIAPLGLAKLVAIIESVIGILVLTLLISEIIHGEEKDLLKKIHGDSSLDRVKKIRAGFYFFRENIENIMKKYRSGERSGAVTINYFNLQILSMSTLLDELVDIYMHNKRELRKEFEADKLIMHFILSLETLKESIHVFNKDNVKWGKKGTREMMHKIIEDTDELESELDKEIRSANKKELKRLTRDLKKYS